MQLLIAYALDDGLENSVAMRLQRVAAHYGQLWRKPVTRRGLDAGRVGLHVWDATTSPCEWPIWQQDPTLAVATLYAPLGYERVVGQVPVEKAALPLGRALLLRPDLVAELTAPFVIGTLEPAAGRVTLMTDALGIGRLYELRFPGGWAWSNRPAATCLFAGMRAEAAEIGWRTFAAAGWFMGDHTPFERVYAVPSATQVGYDAVGPGRVERETHVLDAWAANTGGDPLVPDRVDGLAVALTDIARSLPRLWPNGIVADLSGGRDSRLVAAALLAAGVDVELHTNGALAGEATLAEQLVAALPKPVDHRVVRPAPAGESSITDPGLPTLERAIRFHRLMEGLRSATSLPTNPPDGLQYSNHVLVGGAAGEIAHGFYYPENFAELGALPYAERLQGFLEPLANRLTWGALGSAKAKETAERQIERVLLAAFRVGLDDAKALDYFYAAERLRRWGGTGEGSSIVSPLLAPEFVRAAFDLTQAQRKENALHRAVTARLIPAWAEMPYFQLPAREILPSERPRLALAPDQGLIAELIAEPDQWGDAYDIPAVQRAWRSLQLGDAHPEVERLLQRVIWRAVFTDYLGELNGEEPPHRSGNPSVARPAARGRGLIDRGRRLVARGLRKAARVADSV